MIKSEQRRSAAQHAADVTETKEETRMAYILGESERKYIAGQIDELKELLITLCGIPAPSNHEEKRAEFCKEWFEKAGGKGVYIDDALNVICPVNVTEDNEVVIFMAHTDTVFPDTEPMPLYEEDGKLFCPGVGDDTANLAIMMMVARYMLQSGKKPECGVLFVANSCEEGLGNLKGSRQLMKDFGDRVREVISFDGGLRMLCNGAVGSTRYRIEIKTEGGHSYGSFGNRNAIHHLSSMINTLYTLKVPVDGDSRTTYNVGMISGGTSVNTIAQQAEMLYEYRSNSNACLEKMREMFESVISAYRSMGIEVNVEVLGQRPGMGECRDPERQEKLLERAADILEAVTGNRPGRGSSSTDCNIPFSMGISAVCFGLISGRGAHTREEYIELSSLPVGFEVAMLFIGSYFA